MEKKLRVGLLGFGGMGHFHATQYHGQKYCDLIAVCDINPETFTRLSEEINIGNSGVADLSKVKRYLSYEEMIRNESLDMIDICLPGHLHAPYAIQSMQHGMHVLTEKPMSRTLHLANKMLEISKKTEKKLMVAQCVRFTPSFLFLKEVYDNKKFGSLLRLDFRRLSAVPKKEWYRDARCSGGALLDLHLHDLDFINFMLGVPESLRCAGITRYSGGIDDLIVQYDYPDGPLVSAESSWCRSKWTLNVAAMFEKATLEITDQFTCTVSEAEKKPQLVELKKIEPIFAEIEYFTEAILKNKAPLKCLPESTRDSILIAQAEERSALSGRKVKLSRKNIQRR